MIAKLLRIVGVTLWSETSGVPWKRSTLIYGENGRGKTSLASILRSLSSGDPQPVLERRELTGRLTPECDVLIVNGTQKTRHSFDGVKWSAHYPAIEVFDTSFVSANVYSGDDIDTDQLRRLHRFVLGASGVVLAKTVEDIDTTIRGLNAQAKQIIDRLSVAIADAMSVDDFVSLPELPQPEDALEAQEAALTTAEQAGQIAASKGYIEPKLPDFSVDDAYAVLGRAIDGIGQDAEQIVASHIKEHLGGQGRDWLQTGLDYLGEQADCPFCGVPVGNNELIQAYRSAFNAKYAELRSEVAALRHKVREELSPASWRSIQTCFDGNAGSEAFWVTHGVKPLVTPGNAVKDTWDLGVAAINELVTAKERDTLAAVRPSTEQEEALKAFRELVKSVDNYRQAVRARNDSIATVKREAGKANITDERKKLARLRLRVRRHTPEIANECDALLKARSDKKVLEKEKATAKEALDAATEVFFSKYQDAINRHLKNCGCGYSITGTRTSYSGGKPSIDYQLLLNGREVGLAKPKGGGGEPCFGNTLSDGDRSTLAFAVFLARLDLDQGLSAKVVVIDDPMTSLDEHRRAYTAEQCAGLADRALQLVLLSHDHWFAQDVWNRIRGEVACLEVVEKNGTSSLEEWDIETASRSPYQRDCRLLLDCANGVGGTDPLHVITRIRPVLEDYIRMRFPARFAQKEWLGDMIRAIRGSTTPDPLARLTPVLKELEALNEFTKGDHHGTGGETTKPKPSPTQVKAHAARALEVIYG